MFRHFIYIAKKLYNISNNERFTAYLRKRGVAIGKNVVFREPRTTNIDLSRPCLYNHW